MDFLQSIKESYSEILLNANHKAELIIQKKMPSFLLLTFVTVLSAFICSLGINLEIPVLIYFSFLFVPFISLLFQFSLAIVLWNRSILVSSFLRLLYILIIAICVGLIYFYSSPFAFSTAFINGLGKAQLHYFFVPLFLGILYFLVDSEYDHWILPVLNLVSNWLVFVVLVAFSIFFQDSTFMVQQFNSIIGMWVVFCSGVFLSAFFFKIQKKNYEPGGFVYRAIGIAIISLALLFGGKQIYSLTTNYNLEKLAYAELNSSSFHIENLELKKDTKEITIYYTGIKPSVTQDEGLKKKYRLQSYHIIYQELK